MNYITLKNISFTYKNSLIPAVNNISVKIMRDEIILLTGGNGSGKSTLVKLIMKELIPQQGNILIEETELCKINVYNLGKKIGYMFQEPAKIFFNTSVYEEIAYGLKSGNRNEYEKRSTVEKYLDMFRLFPFRNKLPYKLSEGQKQLVALSAVLAMDNEFMILDEPTTGLDKTNKMRLIEELKLQNKKGKGIIVVSHDNHLINYLGGREIFMSGGKTVEIN